MRLHLVDINKALVEAWGTHFRPFPEVEVTQGDILDVAECCVVSPANSHGFMDGGIDLHYRSFFGSAIEITVQEAIQCRPEGILPVGEAIAVRTGNDRIPYMIVAPTMEMPEAVPAHHSSRAMGAALRTADRHPEISENIYCPGLATLTGCVEPHVAARHMAEAYSRWVQKRKVHS